ncbi:MAG: hypothetical protein ACJAT1_000238 [Marivirga sp.]|jgi:hypothetical protein
METKTCQHCEGPLRGRADKKFCDDYCRNSFNNAINRDKNQKIRNINHALRKNRYILECLLEKRNRRKINKEHLINNGFQTKYYTHTAINNKGDLIYCIYDYGITSLEEEWITVIKR